MIGRSESNGGKMLLTFSYVDYSAKYIRICTYLHMYIHMYIHTYTHVHTHIRTYVHMYKRMMLKRSIWYVTI